VEPRERHPDSPASSPAFDLAAALSGWRATLTAEGMGRTALAELEDHVRTQQAELLRLGLPDEEAWHLAVRRLGAARELAREYAKVDDGVPPVLAWATLGYLAFAVTRSFTILTGGLTLQLTGSIWATVAAYLAGMALPLWGMARLGRRALSRPGLSLALLSGLWLILTSATVVLASNARLEAIRLLESGHFVLFLTGVPGFLPLIALSCAAVLLVNGWIRQRSQGDGLAP